MMRPSTLTCSPFPADEEGCRRVWDEMVRDMRRGIFEEVEALRQERLPVWTRVGGELVNYTDWEQRLEGAD
ncbi:MAG: hypothetical protein KDA28_06840 [Phycisphaerales bacterium]|nr:hypothetical protein [Phycisphaerales bacterium]